MNKYLEAYKEASNLTPKDFLLAKVRKANKLVRQACEKAEKYDELKTLKKPISEYQFGYPTKKYKCICGNYVNKIIHRYCNKCGIKIDWSNE